MKNVVYIELIDILACFLSETFPFALHLIKFKVFESALALHMNFKDSEC